jgi:multiple sugar transport system ATP-binding protein
MTMADRIALMHDGHLQQVAAPEVLYGEPENVFVAGFVGSPKMNILPGHVLLTAPSPVISFLTSDVPVDGSVGATLGAAGYAEVLVGFRPEEIGPCGTERSGPGVVRGVVELVEPLGSETHVSVRVGEQVVSCKFPARSGLTAGNRVTLAIDIERLKIFDAKDGQRLG